MYEFNDQLYKDLRVLRENVCNLEDLQKNSSIVSEIEKKFTLYNAKIINEFINEEGIKPDLIGLHGQTIYHNIKDKISKQIGDGNLLSQLTKCIVINKFRQQDLDNGGQGAPLTPIFHYLISRGMKKKNKIEYPINIINIEGIKNIMKNLNKKKIKKNN